LALRSIDFLIAYQWQSRAIISSHVLIAAIRTAQVARIINAAISYWLDLPRKATSVRPQPIIGGGIVGGIRAKHSHETAEITDVFFTIVDPSWGDSILFLNHLGHYLNVNY
jgi:hypothetical protein